MEGAQAPIPKNRRPPALATCHSLSDNPFKLLHNAQLHGTRTWKLARQYIGNPQIIYTLYNLVFTIEDHITNIISICDHVAHMQESTSNFYIRLSEFYKLPEVPIKKASRSNLSLYAQLLSPELHTASHYTNRYSLLDPDSFNSTMDSMELTTDSAHPNNDANAVNTITPNLSSTNDSRTSQEPFWVNDTGITRLSEVIIHQLESDRKLREASGDLTPSPTPQYEDPAFKTIPTVSPIQHMRFNLIRRRDTTSDITTLKLFKSFANTLREVDPNINLLPYEAAKHHISPLTNGRQIHELDDNKLKLYFRSYHKKQHYSLSGYFHIGTSMEADALFSHPKLLEWLDSY